MSADNIENKTTAFLTVAFLRILRPYFNLLYFVILPLPSRWISPLATNFLSEPSTELMLRDGQSSRISCLVNRPSFCWVAFRPSSRAGSFSSMMVNRSSNAL